MAQGYYGTENGPWSSLHAERIVLTLRSGDPSNPSQGDMWLRTDLDSGDKIATLRFEHASGTWDIPVFPTGSSGSNVEEVARVQTPNGLGYIPLVDPTNYQSFQQLRFQHGGSTLAFSETQNAIPDSGVVFYPESGDLSHFNGDTGSYAANSTSPTSSQTGLSITTSDNGVVIVSTSGLSIYPQPRQIFACRTLLDDQGADMQQNARVCFNATDTENHHQIGVSGAGDELRLNELSSGSSTTVESATYSPHYNESLHFVGEWTSENEITAEVYRENSDPLNDSPEASLTTTISAHQSGGDVATGVGVSGFARQTTLSFYDYEILDAV